MLVVKGRLSKQYLLNYIYILADLSQDPRTLLPPPSVATVAFPEIQKRGVIMVMMQKFEKKSAEFSAKGKIAVPVKYTDDGMDILSNAANISMVLFHVRSRKRDKQYLFRLRDSISFKSKYRVDVSEYYMSAYNVSQTGIDDNAVYLYALLDIDMSEPLDASMLDASLKPFTGEDRYDAQYATLDDLTLKN